MAVIKFCEQNIKLPETNKTIKTLHQKQYDNIEICIVDCFRRCLKCRIKPFCRIQLITIEANNEESLVKKIIQTVQKEKQ
ncbi:DUF1450 domain-containing protein [Priestia megaterium]|uniref:DUF1450 domain-containing protein n=1 Tax=Priestia megaterium TaxID=1404 RepID=UPI002795C66E|nr:DUF1450 domain-containing protein [Priestia megaterium]